MLSNSSLLFWLNVIYALLILVFNIMGMFVINITSAVVRTILEGLRTLCIWIVQVIIYYSIHNKPIGWHHPKIGEELNIYSLMEFSGFLLLFTGTLVYNKILRLPFFDYKNPLGNNPLGKSQPSRWEKQLNENLTNVPKYSGTE